jgi:hypothetical protein
MNGVDYTNRLSRERELYAKSLQDQSKSHEEQVDALKTSNKYKLDKQSEAFSNQKNKMEKSFEDKYQKIDTDQKQALLEKHKQFEKARTEERDEFHKIKSKNLKDFNQRYSDLQKSYGKDIEQRDLNFKQKSETDKKLYSEAIDRTRNKLEEEVNTYKKNALGDSTNIQDKFNDEKREILEKHANEKNQLQRSELEKQNDLKDRVSRDIAQMRESQEKERISSQERSKQRFDMLVEDTNNTIKGVQTKSDIENRRLVEAQQKEAKNQNLQFRDKFVEQERKFNKEVRDLERENRRNGTGSESVYFTAMQKQNEQAEANRQKQIERVSNERNQLVIDHSKAFEKAQEEFNNTYENIKIDNANRRDLMQAEMNQQSIKNRNQASLEKTKLTDDFRVAVKNEKQTGDSRVNDEREQSKSKINVLKEQFRESLTKANHDSKQSIEAAREEFVREKRVLEERISEQNSAKSDALKASHQSQMMKTREGYEKKISFLENQNKELKLTMETKLNEVMNKSQVEVARQQRAFKMTADSEVKMEREAAKSREEQLRLNMVSMQKNFDEKLNEMQTLQNNKINQLTFDYENKLRSEQDKYQQIVEQNKRFSELEQTRLLAAKEDEKARLVSQYEDRIKKLQDVNKQKMQEMERFASMQASRSNLA